MTDVHPSPPPPAAQPAAPLVEAARYALLRRLAPSMRHHLVVNLQPIGMIYEVLDRRLQAPVPNLAQVHESAGKINGFARAALNSCNDVVTWLAPPPGAVVGLEEGVRECVGLVATSLSFRGYALRNQVTDAALVHRCALRNVLTAALIHVTDEAPPPAELVVAAKVEAGEVHLAIELRPAAGEQGFASEATYRARAWQDVEALAAGEAVAIRRDGSVIRLALPLVSAATA
jgi:hypothetical protein